jgi:hypothetical protein
MWDGGGFGWTPVNHRFVNAINVYRGVWTSMDVMGFEFESHPSPPFSKTAQFPAPFVSAGGLTHP